MQIFLRTFSGKMIFFLEVELADTIEVEKRKFKIKKESLQTSNVLSLTGNKWKMAVV